MSAGMILRLRPTHPARFSRERTPSGGLTVTVMRNHYKVQSTIDTIRAVQPGRQCPYPRRKKPFGVSPGLGAGHSAAS